ncbi:MAG: Bax inhibitor-1/YccA family protein [Lachnospiraceae bacterium]|nr:Bax inhibitor-1/YccA family protein [Lachnospiraceae bacterium]
MRTNSFTSNRRAQMMQFQAGADIVTDRVYNLIMGGTIAYGLLMNILIVMFCTDFALRMNPIVFFIAYFVLVIAGTAIAFASQNPLISFLGYNMIVLPLGFVVAIAVYSYGGLTSGVVIQAFAYTLAITAGMIALSIAFPRFFARIGGLLFGGLIGLVIISLIFAFLRISSYPLAIFSAVLFSLYIGYDYYISQQYVKTVDNAIDSALMIYVDIINLFLRLLQLLGRRSND